MGPRLHRLKPVEALSITAPESSMRFNSFILTSTPSLSSLSTVALVPSYMTVLDALSISQAVFTACPDLTSLDARISNMPCTLDASTGAPLLMTEVAFGARQSASSGVP